MLIMDIANKSLYGEAIYTNAEEAFTIMMHYQKKLQEWNPYSDEDYLDHMIPEFEDKMRGIILRGYVEKFDREYMVSRLKSIEQNRGVTELADGYEVTWEELMEGWNNYKDDPTKIRKEDVK